MTVLLKTKGTRPLVLKLGHATESPGGLVTHELLDPAPRASESVGSGWRLKICTRNEFQGDADTALGSTFWEPLEQAPDSQP